MSEVIKKLEQWADALENKGYRQIKHQLRGKCEGSSETGYCCLGVLVEECTPIEIINNAEFLELIKNGEDLFDCIEEDEGLTPGGVKKEFYLNNSLEEVASQNREDVQQWLKDKGIDIYKIDFSGSLEMFYSQELNDSYNLNFKEIADFVRRFHIPFVKKELGIDE